MGNASPREHLRMKVTLNCGWYLYKGIKLDHLDLFYTWIKYFCVMYFYGTMASPKGSYKMKLWFVLFYRLRFHRWN